MLRFMVTVQLIVWVSGAVYGAQSPPLAEDSTDAREVRAPSDETPDWESIKVLDLVSAQRIALRDNPSLQAAGDRVRQAEARVSEAHSAYWPRVDAFASASRVWLADNEYRTALDLARQFDPMATVADPEDYYQGGLAATWVLFDGLAREFSSAVARYGALETEASRMETRRLLLSAVATAYHGGQLARANIAIAQADEAFNQRQLIEAEARRSAGTGSLSDVLNFEVRVNGAKTELITTERVYRVALIGLAELMGIPGASFPERVELAGLQPEATEELVLPAAEPEVVYAQENRPDMVQARYALERTRASVGFARSEYLPSLDLTGSVDGNRANSGRFEADDFGSTVALSLSYNLFDGGGRRARLRGAKAVESEAEKNFESTQIAVAAEVRQALAQLKSAQEQLILQRSNVVLVEKTRDLVEKEYRAGQSSLVRLNEAQRDLTTAQSRLALALVSLRQAWQNLETATGRILTASQE